MKINIEVNGYSSDSYVCIEIAMLSNFQVIDYYEIV